MKLKPTVMWFIGGRWANGNQFLYTGCNLTRRAAISDHEAATGRTWADLRRCGDFTVKCCVVPSQGSHHE